MLSVIAVISLLAAVFILSEKQKEEKIYTKDLFAMDTYFSMKAYGGQAQEALEAAADRIREMESLFSVTAEGSDLWRIGHASTEGPTAVNEDTYRLAAEAVRLGDETGGALDITLYPVLKKWGFTTGEYRVPEQLEIAEALGKADYRKIRLVEETRAIDVPDGMELDFGAVAKGYAGDRVIAILREAGVTSAILDLGGNVQTLGTKPDGSLWKVGIKDPFDPGKELGVLKVADRAVVTSGGYERYFMGEDGERYWHILNPADGYPAKSGLASVTVVGESGVVCDGLSTALFVMGMDRAVAFWRQQDFELILVTDEGELFLTEGLAEDFVCGDGWHAEVISR